MKNLSSYKEKMFDRVSRHPKKIIRYRLYMKDNQWCTASDLHRLNVVSALKSVHNPLKYKWQVRQNRGEYEVKAYQVVLVDGDGASFQEHVTPKVFINRNKAEDYKQFFIDEDAGWWRVYVKEVELVE